jgi:hypothetical protein
MDVHLYRRYFFPCTSARATLRAVAQDVFVERILPTALPRSPQL